MDRILMVTPYLKSQRGNSVTAVRLSTGLRRKGYMIDLISMDEPGWQSRLDRYTHANSYDLVHGFHALHFTRAANHPVVKRLPLILTTTGTDINYDLSGPQKGQVLETMLQARKIVVFNPNLGRQLTTTEPRLQSRQAVIPQGVKLHGAVGFTRQHPEISSADTVFVIPSGLRPVKNLDLALDGLAVVYRKHPQICLLIVGAAIDAEYTAHIKSRLDALKWAHYLGEVPHQNMRGILQAADIVLNTSRAEGQPQGALEAMSLGKPCILTAVPGNLGIIEDGIHGCYINSAPELASAALKLIQNPLLRHAMGKTACQLVYCRYSAEKELTAYDQLYKSCILNNRAVNCSYRMNQNQG